MSSLTFAGVCGAAGAWTLELADDAGGALGNVAAAGRLNGETGAAFGPTSVANLIT